MTRGRVQTPSACPRGGECVSVHIEGGCACGAVRYRLTSDPLFTHCCHCLNCQRQTGSAFVINLLIEADRVQMLAGEAEPVDVPRDDGSAQRIFRCPTCQVAVFSQYTRPEVRFVRGGTLDQPSSARARRTYLSPSPSSPGSRFRTRCRRSRSTTTSECLVASRQSRALRGDHGGGELRRLRRSRAALT